MENLLFTGASGFLGLNTLPYLKRNYSIKTIGLSNNDNFKLNLALDVVPFTEHYDVVIHAAGKAHSIPKNIEESQEFFAVNLQGTKNLCVSLEKCSIPRSLVFISSIAVYGLEFGEDITEETPLNGVTPYALSKIQAEQFLIEWCDKHSVILSIVRPSLLAGPNPPGNLGDMIGGIKTGRYLGISSGQARKSVLMVQDIAELIPKLAIKGGIYNVCDTDHPTFRELENLIAFQLGKANPKSIPYSLAKLLAIVGDIYGEQFPINSRKLNKITKSLTFSNEKARKELCWKPLNVLEHFKIE